MCWLGLAIGMFAGCLVGALIMAFFSSKAYGKGFEDGRRTLSKEA